MAARNILFAFIAALALGVTPAIAQSYPSRVIKLVVPFTAGSPNDVMARLLTQHLGPRLGQPVVIDNKPGGGTTIGSKMAAAAEPDGHPLLVISSALVTDPAMKGATYDPLTDFAGEAHRTPSPTDRRVTPAPVVDGLRYRVAAVACRPRVP
ncbi:MAG: tripartite tricarboxylate transporter substrate-binding protein, partial [Hyphomicrobiales bacterium]